MKGGSGGEDGWRGDGGARDGREEEGRESECTKGRIGARRCRQGVGK